MKKSAYLYNPFATLTAFEWGLWTCSALVVLFAFFFGDTAGGILCLVTSLVGVTALIFTAKGDVLGQVLIVLFAILYSICSLRLHYYSEVITYLGMSAPIAVLSIVSWLHHPFAGRTHEVAIHQIRRREALLLLLLTVAVTFGFYFILRALNTPALAVSTLSIATSFFAACCSLRRSPYYALAYCLNDVVLIVLWTIAAIKDTSYLSNVACFFVFFANDLYGFLSWRTRQRRQKRELAQRKTTLEESQRQTSCAPDRQEQP